MASKTGVIYVGVTNNVLERALEHKNGVNDGFSKKYKCHKLVYYETGNKIIEAIAREKEIKGWRRSKKTALINSINPKWDDLVTKIDTATKEE